MPHIEEEFRLDQPRPNDLVGNPVLLAGSGGAYEGTIGIRVLDGNGAVIKTTFTTSSPMARQWQSTVALTDIPTTRGVIEIGPDAPEGQPPWVSVPVFFGPAIVQNYWSYFGYVVQPGDTLSGIATGLQGLSPGLTYQAIHQANEHIVFDPNLIQPGTTLRIPVGNPGSTDDGDGSSSGLHLGDSGPEVVEVQNQLLSMRFAIGEADGDFGLLTDEAVRGFQLVVGLPVDGVVGPGTKAALDDGSWDAVEIVHSALGSLSATEIVTSQINETVLELNVSWQRFVHDRYSIGTVQHIVEHVVDDLVATARRRARRHPTNGLTYSAPNALDLAAPSLASTTLLVSEFPPPSGWVRPLRLDLAADRALAPEELFMPGIDFPAALQPFVAAAYSVDPARYAPTYDNYDLLAIRPGGVRVYFDPGHLLMEHFGIQHVDVPFGDLIGAIRPSIVARAAPGLTVEAPAGPLTT